MALIKVLSVTADDAAVTKLENVIALSWTATHGSFRGTGDATLAIHKGRAGHVTGTVTVEDMDSAETAMDNATVVDESKAFTGVIAADGVADTCSITFTEFTLTGLSVSIGDGLAVGAPIPGIALTFSASSVVVAAT